MRRGCMEDQRAHQSGRDEVAYAEQSLNSLYARPNRKAATRNAPNYKRRICQACFLVLGESNCCRPNAMLTAASNNFQEPIVCIMYGNIIIISNSGVNQRHGSSCPSRRAGSRQLRVSSHRNCSVYSAHARGWMLRQQSRAPTSAIWSPPLAVVRPTSRFRRFDIPFGHSSRHQPRPRSSLDQMRPPGLVTVVRRVWRRRSARSVPRSAGWAAQKRRR